MNIYKFNLKPILYLLLIFALCFTEGIGIMFISIPITFLIFFLITMKNKFILILKKSYKYLKEIRLLITFFIIAIISATVNIFTHHITLLRFLLSILITYILSFAIYYLFGLLLPFLFNNKKIIKLFITSLFIIIFFGFIEFIIFSLNIYSFDSVLTFMMGRTSLLGYKTGLIPRIQSLFLEPSHYAWFLVCIIPLVININNLNKKLYKNIYLNILMKKLLLPFVLISLLLTRSPINLILGIIVYILSLLTLNKITLKKLLKIISVILIMLLIILIIMFQVPVIYDTITTRIIAGSEIFSNFEILIHAEASFATRIISYVNMFIIWTHHPILGTGCGSLASELYNQLPNSPLPLTYELNMSMLKPKPNGANPSIFFKLLVDTGIVGLISFMLFYYQIYNKINIKLKNFYYDINYFLHGIKGSMVVFSVLSIYDSTITSHFLWCLFGVISGLSLKQKLYINKLRNFKLVN